MKTELIRQGHPIGWQDKDKMEAYLNQDAPLSFIDELLADGYAVCVASAFQGGHYGNNYSN